MAIDLGSASASLSLDINNFVTNAQRAADAAQNIRSATDNATSGGFLGWVQQNEQALNSWGKGLLGFGALVTGAFVAPIAAGSRAAWGQVDAIEQATVAMNAYADSSEDVEMVLGSLLDYARSAESGGLFWREELFASAQSMLIYGASIEEVDGYVKILSRSVGLGLSDWDSLNTIIGRVGSTGRLTGNDFDMLKARGFDLDESIRNTNITWEELFEHLDAGIPADALEGQMDTIRGKSLWLQDALQGLGQAFLGVDADSGKFIEGGLGWQMVRGIERLTDLMLRAAPAVRRLGEMFAAIGRPIGTAIDLLIRLPQPIQTAMVLFTGALGAVSLFSGGLLLMLPRIASTVAAFQAFGGITGILSGVTKAVGALRVAMVGLFMNPAMLAAIAVIGAGILAYKTNFLGFGDMVRDAVGWVMDLFEALQLVFGTPSSKTIAIYDDWQADKYTIQAETLPDGTKVWNIVEDETGETFGQILDSYSGEQGEAYILIQPEDGGPAFWANADLESGKPEKIDVPVDAETGMFEGRLKVIKAENGEHTVVVDGDDQPFAVVLDGIMDPATGNKLITLQMANGDTFVAEVDAVTGEIESVREVTIEADTNTAEGRVESLRKAIESALSWFNEFSEQFNAFMSHDWETFDWRKTLDLVGLEGMIEPIETLISWFDNLVGAIDAAAEAYSAFLALIGVSGRAESDPQYEATQAEYNRQIGTDMPDVTRTPWTPKEDEFGVAINPTDFTKVGAAANIGAYFRDAADGAGLFSSALHVLNPEIMRSNDIFNTVASTGIPGYTSATSEADSATGAMAGNMSTSFGQVASDATANFSAMQSEATSRTAALNQLATADTNSMRSAVLNNMLQMRSGASSNASGMESAVAGSMLGMRTRSATQLALLASSASTQTSSMQRNAATNASSMRSSVAGSMLGMKTSAALQMGLMASSARTSGSQMDSGLTGWMTGARVRIVASMASMVQAVRNTGSTGYNAGHYAGSRIGEGMAAGMNAWLGNIRASANAMVAAASAAVVARAMISSPSRLFMQYGEYIGEGLEIGMRNMIPEIGRTADRMIDTSVPSPAFNTPIGHGGYGGGGTTVIDNSRVEYIALTESDFQQLLRKSERGDQAYRFQADPDSHRYGGDY